MRLTFLTIALLILIATWMWWDCRIGRNGRTRYSFEYAYRRMRTAYALLSIALTVTLIIAEIPK